MRKTIISIIVILAIISLYRVFVPTPAKLDAKPVVANPKEVYVPRYVKNIEVINYNIIGERTDRYEQRPQRIIAVGENITETLVALGVEDQIICAVSYGNPDYEPEPEYAERYQTLRFAKNSTINTEVVLAMQPDLIIAGQSLFSGKGLKSTAFWNQRKIHTFLAFNANAPASRKHQETLELEYKFILGLGTIFDRTTAARQIVARMQNTIDRLSTRAQGVPKPKVMIIEQLGKHLVAYDATKLAGDICTKLGAEVLPSPLGTVDLEYLLAVEPEVIFVVKSGGDAKQAAESFKQIPGLQSLQAVKNNRVHGISLNYTYNSAIKTEAGIKQFARGIYPELEVR
ncbi:MAG: ABC transporter substrate-binding protein [Acidaminococcaceae bacterium]